MTVKTGDPVHPSLHMLLECPVTGEPLNRHVLRRQWYDEVDGDICRIYCSCHRSFVVEYDMRNRREKQNTTLWVCGKSVMYYGQFTWEFQGLFSSEEKAIAACLNENHFIGPAVVDKVITDDTQIWPGAYYPLADEE